MSATQEEDKKPGEGGAHINLKVKGQQQKAKHFKCHICHKKLSTASGMVIHVLQVHKENVTKVPNAKSERDSTDIEIYGMQGTPPDVLAAHYREEEEESPAKVAKLAIPSAPLGGAVPKAYGMVYQPQQVPGAVQPMYYPGPPVRPGWPMPPPRLQQWYQQNPAVPPAAHVGYPPQQPFPVHGMGITMRTSSPEVNGVTPPGISSVNISGNAGFSASVPCCE